MGDCEMTSDLIDEGKELIRRGIWIFVTTWRQGTVQSLFSIGSDLKNGVSFAEKRKRQRIEDGENRRRVSVKTLMMKQFIQSAFSNREK